jgi:L-galactose dehydrogenase
MDKTTLGRTGLSVSVACLGGGGASKLGQRHGATFEHSVNVVKAALDAGVNFLDTAAIYKTEAIVGEAIKGRPRESIVISTKNLITQPGSDEHGENFVTPAEYKAEIERSLKRLGTDYVDIFHLHGILAHQYKRCIDDFLPVVERLRDEGKVRFIAISERFYHDTQHEMLRLALNDDHFDVMMVGLNMINQSALRDILPAAKKKNIGIQSMHAVRGKLASREGVRALIEAVVESGEVDAADIDRDDPLGFVLKESGASSIVEACYRFNRHAPGCDTVLTGTGNIAHLKDNLRAIGGKPLPAPVVEKLARIFGRVESVSAD